MSTYRQYIKPLADVTFASVALVVFLPVLCMITIIQAFLYRASPLFLQKRPGRKEKLFTLIKFRTMLESKDEIGNLLSCENRTTAFGAFLRSTSLDELPQLLNVIKGDMSLVGPRPLLDEYLPLYSAAQKRRHEVRPGITGWAQVNGRNEISWEEKFELDLWYLENMSFKTDLKIIFLTIKQLIKSLIIREVVQTENIKFKGSAANQLAN